MTSKQPRVLAASGITAVCAAVGLAAVAAVAVVAAGQHNPFAHPLAFAVLTALLAYTHVRPTRLVHRHGAVESDHLDEALFVPMVLVLTPVEFALAVIAASLAGNLAAHRRPVKVLFNVGQTVLTSLAGLAVARSLGAGPESPLTAVTILACCAGGVVFAVASSAAVAGILRLASGQRLLAGLRDQLTTRAVSSCGALLLGVVCGIAAHAQPFAALPALGLGWVVEQAYAATVVQKQARGAAEALQAAVVAVRNSGDPEEVRAQVLTAAGTVLHARSTAFVATGSAPVPGGLRVPVEDNTDLQVADRVGGGSWLDTERDALNTLAAVAADALRNARLVAHLRAITDGQSEGVLAVDDAGRITFANPAARQLLAAGADLLHRPAADIFSLERAGSPVDLRALAGAHIGLRDEDAVLQLDDRRIPVAFTAAGLTAPQTGTVLVLHDITERKAFEEKLSYLAFHDPLTGLPNRRLFADRLEHAVTRAARHGTRHALLMFDLDRFKLVNDSYGHPAGDELLGHVADLLRHTLRDEDTCARLGGDEFAVLLEDIEDLGTATRVADRILAALAEGCVIAGHDVFVSASIGVATSDQVNDCEEFIAAADAAAYAAKAAGKGCYRVFATSVADEARTRLELESSMRHALEQGEFELYYQPLVDTHTGAMIGTEALVRWNSADGLVPPVKFIPLAEETGFIVPLGAWVLEEACRQTREWTLDHPDRPPLKVSVNLSAHQFSRPAIVAEVAAVLERTGLSPEQLCLEITETVVMTDAQSTIATLQALKDLGLQVAIDDFGTGYSSLSYLKRFPVDVVKIDQSFTSGLGESPVDTEIVAAVVRLAAACGITAVAEGVETVEQRHALDALGCPVIQGYLIAKPQRAGEFADLWDTSPVALESGEGSAPAG